MKWNDSTEICVGFVLHGKLSPDAINPADCFPPYGEIIPIMRDGGSVADVVTKVGYASVRTAMEAAEHVNGEMKPLAWVGLNSKNASRELGAASLERVAKDMKDGKEVDLGKAMQLMSNMNDGYRELTPLSEVEPERDVWIKTGWKPLDDNVGGIVKAGLCIIGASPGVGKTTMLLKIANCMVRKYKRHKVAIFSLEMTMGQLAKRWQELDDTYTKEEKDRVLITESAFNIGEIYAAASTCAAQERLSLIAIDFADLMVEGEQSESIMGQIYRSLAMLAKKTGVPVILISQLNRATYMSGIPKVNHLRYSGMAEAMAALILLLYNPHNILADFGRAELVAAEGTGYVIAGKSRFGFKKGGPGGIQIAWDGEGGWGDETLGFFALTV